MATHYRTNGFIIKKTDRDEADQFFTIYTKGYGKLKILGKAIRKINSKLRSGAELFYLSDIEFIQGKNHKTLTDAILMENFPDIRKDLGKLKIVHQIAELLDSLMTGEEKDELIWWLLCETLKKLNSLEIRNYNLEILYYYFFWNLVSLLGYRPELKPDSLKGKKINTDIAKILKITLNKDWSILSRLKIEPSHLELLKNISEWYKIELHEK